MQRALAEARKGLGRTHPNPPVGAVIVRDGQIVAVGHHRKAGEPHAEVEAIQRAGDLARGADMYVTLEPCNHQGRTGPCSLAVLRAGLKRVFIGSIDPNPRVSGGGIERLRAGGAEVFSGVCGDDCDTLIRPFARHIRTGLPWVVLKAAASLDGRIATRTGDSRWVTGPEARRLVHVWRDEMDAVLVGAGTVRADEPLLTTRLDTPAVEGRTPRTPLRVVLSERLNLSPDAQLFDVSAGPVLVFTSTEGPVAERLRERGVEVLVGHYDVTSVVRTLGQRGLTSVLVEGGGRVHRSFLRAGVADELRLFLAPKIVGGDGLGWVDALGLEHMRDAITLQGATCEPVGADLLITARLPTA